MKYKNKLDNTQILQIKHLRKTDYITKYSIPILINFGYVKIYNTYFFISESHVKER